MIAQTPGKKGFTLTSELPYRTREKKSKTILLS